LAEAVGHLAHGNVHDLLFSRHAGDAELPGLAHIEQGQRVAALAAGDEFSGRDLGDLLGSAHVNVRGSMFRSLNGAARWRGRDVQTRRSTTPARSEYELRRSRRVHERRDDGLEQADALPFTLAHP